MSYGLFNNKIVLAPMVRVSKLPMRLLALDYGADMVYCEEVVDFKMLQSRKVENKLLNTIDFLLSDDSVAFRTCSREKSFLVFQMGTSNAQRAVKVAKMVEPYVAAIDVNMGCPKEFSTKEGMGAALLDHPGKITEILTSLVESLSIPVTCKIRIKPKLEDTLELVRTIEATGVQAIAVHGRTREERPNHRNHDDAIAAVVGHTRLPVIANGGSSCINSYKDIGAFKISTAASSVMVARAAMYNPSIFQPAPSLQPTKTVIKQFLRYAVQYDSHPMHVKYVIQNMLHQQLNTPLGLLLLQAKTVLDICLIWGMEDHYKEMEARRVEGGRDGQTRVDEGLEYGLVVMEDGSEVYQMDYKYDRKDTGLLSKSKMSLYNWTLKHRLRPPTYHTIVHPTERSYRSIVTVNELKFTSSVWNKSDKFSQRASAHVCLLLMYLPSFSSRLHNLLSYSNVDSLDNVNDTVNKINDRLDTDQFYTCPTLIKEKDENRNERNNSIGNINNDNTGCNGESEEGIKRRKQASNDVVKKLKT